MPPFAADLPPLWLPPKPAIIRPATADLLPRRQGFIPGTFGRARRPGIARTYINSANSTANQTTYDLGDFTAASAGLMIVAAAGSGASGTVASISIGGTNGTLHINPSGSSGATGIASRVVAAGANNVSVTFSTGMQRGAVSVWLLTGYTSATPIDTDGINTTTTTPSFTATLDTQAGGVLILVAVRNNATSGSLATATARLSQVVETPYVITGDLFPTVTATGFTEVITLSDTGSRSAGYSAVSWR